MGDCLEKLKDIPDNSLDLCLTDFPYCLTSITRPRPDQTKEDSYGREVPFSKVQSRIPTSQNALTEKSKKRGGFMSKLWDGEIVSVDILKEIYRVLKSGAYLVTTYTPRQDSLVRILTNLESAGFNIQFSFLNHIYLSGFPKAANLSLMIDFRLFKEWAVKNRPQMKTKPKRKFLRKLWKGDGFWAKRWLEIAEKLYGEVVGVRKEIGKQKFWGHNAGKGRGGQYANAYSPTVGEVQEGSITTPSTPQAKYQEGWFTNSLKPSFEPILVAMKPLYQGDKNKASLDFKQLKELKELLNEKKI